MATKILLVEDDTTLSEIYQARLQAEGYEILSAPDGENALAIAVKEHPDLIISDVMMPKISGFDMLDILRGTDGIKDTKVIMMTALSQAEDEARADKLGADRYLVKSQVTLEDVIKTVQEVLGGQATAPAASTTTTTEPSTSTAPISQTSPQPAANTSQPVAATPTPPTTTAEPPISENSAPEPAISAAPPAAAWDAINQPAAAPDPPSLPDPPKLPDPPSLPDPPKLPEESAASSSTQPAAAPAAENPNPTTSNNNAQPVKPAPPLSNTPSTAQSPAPVAPAAPATMAQPMPQAHTMAQSSQAAGQSSSLSTDTSLSEAVSQAQPKPTEDALSQIQDFVNQQTNSKNPLQPVSMPDPIEPSQNPDSPTTKPAEPSLAASKIAVTPAPETTSDADAETTDHEPPAATSKPTANAKKTIAATHQKVIQPPKDSQTKPNFAQLLAKDEAKNITPGASASAPSENIDAAGQPGSTIQPSGAQDTNPSNISL
ncbi:MAG: response regulator [Candidatus Saccharimonadales bacterium]